MGVHIESSTSNSEVEISCENGMVWMCDFVIGVPPSKNKIKVQCRLFKTSSEIKTLLLMNAPGNQFNNGERDRKPSEISLQKSKRR